MSVDHEKKQADRTELGWPSGRTPSPAGLQGAGSNEIPCLQDTLRRQE